MFPEVARWLEGEIDKLPEHGGDHICINLGSGLKDYWRHAQPWIGRLLDNLVESGYLVLNVDRKPELDDGGKILHIQADAADVPLPAGSATLILCLSMLEHTESPKAVVNEVKRLLAPKGCAFFEVPADYPLHADPIDSGLRMHMIEEWEDLLGPEWEIVTFSEIYSPSKHGSCTLIEATHV